MAGVGIFTGYGAMKKAARKTGLLLVLVQAKT
jgi:hypothetical protein